MFFNTFSYPWIYDDIPVIVENPDIRSLSNFWQNSYPDRPMRELSFMLDRAIFGMNPFGWHFQQVFWHALNGFLVFLLACRLTVSRAVALAAGALFLTHPIQVEVVANISHRKDSLALAFCLLCVLFFWNALDRWDAERRFQVGWLGASAACFFIALLAKQNAPAVLVPLVILLVRHVGPTAKRYLLAGCAGGALAALGAIVWKVGGAQGYLAKIHPLMLKMNYGGTTADVGIYLLLMLKAWALMLKNFFLPTRLAPEYTFSLPAGILDPWVMAAGLAVVIYVAALAVSRKRSFPLFFGLAWFGAFWVPTANILPLSYFVADRYWYAPSAGLIIALTCGLYALCRKKARPFVVVALLLVGLLSALTWQQNRVWRSPVALWSQALAVSPDSTSALNNLGAAYMLEGRYSEALPLFMRAAKNFNESITLYNLGWAYDMLGDKRSAYRYYSIFVSMNEPQHRALVKKARQRLRQL